MNSSLLRCCPHLLGFVEIMIHRVTHLFSPVTIVLPTKQEIINFVNFLISALK